MKSNAVYDKTMENLKKRIDVKLMNNEKDYFKQTSKPSHIFQNKKTFHNDSFGMKKQKLH